MINDLPHSIEKYVKRWTWACSKDHEEILQWQWDDNQYRWKSVDEWEEVNRDVGMNDHEEDDRTDMDEYDRRDS